MTNKFQGTNSQTRKGLKIGAQGFLFLHYFGRGIIVDAGIIDILVIYGRLNRVWQAAIFVLTVVGNFGRLYTIRNSF